MVNNVINPIHSQSEDLTLCYLRLHGSIYYFEYAVGAVHAQEWALTTKQADGAIVGSAVAVYSHMDSCLRMFDLALNGTSNPQARLLRREYRDWKENHIRHIRDRVAAHPEEDEKRSSGKKFFVMSKRSSICSNGTVVIRQIAVKVPHESDMISLTPRQDLEKLKSYLEQLSVAVTAEFPGIESVQRQQAPTHYKRTT